MKKLMVAIVMFVGIFAAGLAHADLITATVTADNSLSLWNGSSWVAEGNDWMNPTTIDLNITAANDEVYFAVSNDDWANGGNPAGLLASFLDTDGTFTITGTDMILSSPSTMKIKAVRPWIKNPSTVAAYGPVINPKLNPTKIKKFKTPTSYGDNDSSSIWADVNGGPVSGISPDAQWLWTKHNDGNYYTENDYAIFEVNLGVNSPIGNLGSPTPTPEPSTMLLFALGCAFVFFLARRKMIRTA